MMVEVSDVGVVFFGLYMAAVACIMDGLQICRKE
jgi:hypothetical protein